MIDGVIIALLGLNLLVVLLNRAELKQQTLIMRISASQTEDKLADIAQRLEMQAILRNAAADAAREVKDKPQST